MAPAVDEVRPMDIEEGDRDIEAWQGLTVRTREGHVVGRVVDVFADGPLAGRLRVRGPTCSPPTRPDRCSAQRSSPSPAVRCCAGTRTAWNWARAWVQRGPAGSCTCT